MVQMKCDQCLCTVCKALGLVVSTRLVDFFHQVLGGVLVVEPLGVLSAVCRVCGYARAKYGFVKSPLSLGATPTPLQQAIGRGGCWLVLMVTVLIILPRAGMWELDSWYIASWAYSHWPEFSSCSKDEYGCDRGDVDLWSCGLC